MFEFDSYNNQAQTFGLNLTYFLNKWAQTIFFKYYYWKLKPQIKTEKYNI